MDNATFDRYVKGLWAGASRRRVLGGMLGAATAALAGGAGPGATPTQAARKQRRRPGHGGADDFVAVCHVTGREAPERIRVRGRRALRAHLRHGDFRYGDCCANDDCDVPTCFTGQCVSGTCSQTQLPADTPCSYGAGALGYCTADARCLPKATVG